MAGETDGPVSRWLNRRLSRPLATALARTPVSPDAVTWLSLALAAGAGTFVAAGWNVVGGVGVQLASVVDGVDGDLARRTGRTSRRGALLDAVLDRYADAAVIAGLGYFAAHHQGYAAPYVAAAAALAGSLAVSYTRARAEASAGVVPGPAFLGLASRDVRLLALAVGAVSGQVYWTLWGVAAVALVTVGWRLWRLWRWGRT